MTRCSRIWVFISCSCVRDNNSLIQVKVKDVSFRHCQWSTPSPAALQAFLMILSPCTNVRTVVSVDWLCEREDCSMQVSSDWRNDILRYVTILNRAGPPTSTLLLLSVDHCSISPQLTTFHCTLVQCFTGFLNAINALYVLYLLTYSSSIARCSSLRNRPTPRWNWWWWWWW